MDDEELRSELTALMVPADRIAVPDARVLRRRLRRRRNGQATVGVLAVACAVAGLGAGLTGAPVPSGNGSPGNGSPGAAGACASGDLRATWLAPATVNGQWMEAPPVTYRLALRNTGRSRCWLEGWPRLVPSGSDQPRSVSVSYRTHFNEWVGSMRSRVVQPTRVMLEPHARALSAVTVATAPSGGSGCVSLGWAIRPPSPGAGPLRSHGRLPTLCDPGWIVVSPVYPASVPLTALGVTRH